MTCDHWQDFARSCNADIKNDFDSIWICSNNKGGQFGPGAPEFVKKNGVRDGICQACERMSLDERREAAEYMMEARKKQKEVEEKQKEAEKVRKMTPEDWKRKNIK